ncbi:MAG TPA: double zinc ribbon domain-containing protein, partial [Verrucomicrobiae bacterium]|nr:double zinc ribbon domain-containing protein [Verrucomicrobiae bacterium]
MSIIDRFIGLLAPYECLSCGAEGELLCQTCIQQLPMLPPQCYRCLEVSSDGRTCSACLDASELYSLRALTPYAGHAKDLVWRLKSGGARAAAAVMAKGLLPLLPRSSSQVIVPVPTASSRVRSRGYDQAGLLARELGRRSRLPCGDHLRRQGQTRQIGTSRRQRLNQLQTAFRLSGATR